MYVLLHESLSSLEASQWPNYAFEVDMLLGAHMRGALLLCLSPAQVMGIRDALPLGPVAKVTLSTIQRRGSEYNAALRQATRAFRLCADEILATSFRINADGTVDIPIREFVRTRASHHPQLFVEHVLNDRLALEMLFSAYCKDANVPSSLINIRPAHGGGSGLGDVLRSQPLGAAMGLCVCDRDCHPFDPTRPFKPGGTASAAYDAAQDISLLFSGEYGLSTRDPFFAYHLTHPRTVEGYIGPHLLDVYFAENRQTIASRSIFLAAFPRFPDLGEGEMAMWFALNLKDANLTKDEITAATYAAGYDIDRLEVNIDSVLKASIPSTATSWIAENMQIGRHKGALHTAFRRDLASERYHAAVAELSTLMWDLLAGDSRMMTA